MRQLKGKTREQLCVVGSPFSVHFKNTNLDII